MKDFFKATYGEEPSVTIKVPGRVNLIGEHVDYNGGSVLPYALSSGVSVSARLADDKTVQVGSDRFEGVETFQLSDNPAIGWARYAFFSAKLASELGWWNGGVDLAITSNLNDGAGLSSSAALCVATLKALRQLTDQSVDDAEIARIARRVENECIGMPCGIMDQMAVAVPAPGQALFLDTRDLGYETLDLPKDHAFIVVHSGVHRELADGRYKERKEECDLAKDYFGTDDLCHLDLDHVNGAADLDPAAQRRARHCVTEHERVVHAARALQSKDYAAFGRLMHESHQSMRDDFQMTVEPIDRLVETAEAEGALGARLTGGGFGGAIVALVQPERADEWWAEVSHQHPAAFIVDPGVWEPRDG